MSDVNPILLGALLAGIAVIAWGYFDAHRDFWGSIAERSPIMRAIRRAVRR